MAVLHDEDGAEMVVEAIAEGAAISAANWAEVLTNLAERGRDPREARERNPKSRGVEASADDRANDCRRLHRDYSPAADDQDSGSFACRSGLPGFGRATWSAGRNADREWVKADVAAEIQLIR